MSPEADKPGLGTGLRAAGRGVRRVCETPELIKTYVQLVAVLFILAGFFSASGIWTVLHFTPIDGTESWWVLAGMWLLRIGGIVLVALVSPILALFVSNTLFPFLGERVFLAGVRAVSPARADELAAIEGMPMRVSVPQNLVRMALFIGLSFCAFVVSFIPVVGVVLGPVLQAYFTSRALGWELLDPYFEKLDVRFKAQREFVRQHRAPMVGFALPFSLVMSIPLFGPLLFGVAQAAAGTLVVEVLEAKPGQPAA